MFKRSSLIFVLVLCFWQVNAQFAKGDKFVGGSVSFFSTQSETQFSETNNFFQPPQDVTSLILKPQLHFFTSDNIAFGIGFGYERRAISRSFLFTDINGILINDEKLKTVTQFYDFIPSFRYYWKLANRAGFFLDIEGSIGKGKSENEDNPNIQFFFQPDQDIFRLGIDLAPKFYYFIAKRLSIEASFGGIFYDYSMTKNTDQNFSDSETNTTNLGINFINTFTLSFNYFFGKSFKKQ